MSAKFNGGIYGITTALTGALGLSTVTGYASGANVVYSEVKNISPSGGGIVYVAGASMLGSSLVSVGYALGVNEVLKIWGPSAFYITPTGASCSAAVLRGIGE